MMKKSSTCIIFILTICTMNIFAKNKVNIPLNLGAGPAFNNYNGIIGDDQTFHYALKLNIHAVIDKTVIKQNKKKIPKKYRNMASKINEVHFGKWWIPESIIISPHINNTALYGLNIRPIGITLGLITSKSVYLNVGTDLNITYLYIKSNTLFNDTGNSASMNFFRPGIDINPEFKIKFSKKIHISLGAEANFYIPQTVSSSEGIFSFGGFNNESLWNMNQLYILFNYRVPFKVKI